MICKVCKLKKKVNIKRLFNFIDKAKVKQLRTGKIYTDVVEFAQYEILPFFFLRKSSHTLVQ